MNLYRPLLANALFPAFEAARGRPTVPLLRYLECTERTTLDQLRDLQLGLLRRLLRHASQHAPHYREILAARGLAPEDFDALDVLERLPLLDRETARRTLDARTAAAPPHWVIQRATRGTTGEPVVVKYNAESRHWRDATRWRAYGWAGYRIGMRALHDCGPPEPLAGWMARQKVALDRALKRDLHVDFRPSGDAAVAGVVEQLQRFAPRAIVAPVVGAVALARFVHERALRTWPDIPVIVGAARLWPRERALIEAAFGPAFETYGCREVMLIGAECAARDGLHTAMETMIVELVVREPGGAVRAARPGELGEIAITDLHNLACPMIRYLTGDAAIARDDRPCACGRGLARIGPIERGGAARLRNDVALQNAAPAAC